MRIWARILVAVCIAVLIFLGFVHFNLEHLARNLGYDEVYYFFWVNNWENYQVYYPHHLLFTPSSVAFQKYFTEATGIENTAFIQTLKNILALSVGVSLFFLMFYLHSRRLLLSFLLAVSIGLSASVWHDAQHHETALIPGIIINLAMLSLVFYRNFRVPVVFICIFAAANSAAILLHQAFLFSVIPPFLVFLFTSSGKEYRRKVVKRLCRTALYTVLMIAMVGGAYFYVGFVKLNLRLTDNPEGEQRYMALPIDGNFYKYFYLLKGHDKWGGKSETVLQDGMNGYISSFIVTFRTWKVNPTKAHEPERFSSHVALIFIVAALGAFIVFLIPAIKRYGVLLPALLVWMILGALFIFWWEPWYIEHWLYITILTWVLLFLVCTSALEAVPVLPLRLVLYFAVLLGVGSVTSVMYYENYNVMIKDQMKLFLPASRWDERAWRESYKMEEIYRKIPEVE